MFSVIYDNYEKNLKQELWMCHKNKKLTMEEIYQMTIRDRKFYIQTHNKAIEKEIEQINNEFGLTCENGIVTTTSLKVAEIYGKDHGDVLKKIRKFIELIPELGQGNFSESSYINEQNKPFNANTIFENLHKEIKKAQVVRVLSDLAQEYIFLIYVNNSGKIIEKEYGKSKVYFANQDQFPEVDESELKQMDEEIGSLEEEATELKTALASLRSRNC